MTYQLPLFDDPDLIQVAVWQEGDHYIAVIENGWWMAYGKTKKDAIKKVVENYKKERTMQWNG